MSGTPDTLAVAGLPSLAWERGSGWRCEAVLPAWAGFTMRDTDDQPPGKGTPTSSEVSVSFDSLDVHTRTPPSPAQVETFRRLVVEGEAIRDAVLQAAFDEFRDWLSGKDAIAVELGGPLVDPTQLTRLIRLNVVNISVEPKGGEAQVNLDFDCMWDHEHGFMAVVTQGQVTYVGPR